MKNIFYPFLLISILFTSTLKSMNNEVLNTPVQLASKEELERRFASTIGGLFGVWAHFMEKAQLADALGNQKVSPSQVMQTLNDTFNQYFRYTNRNPILYAQGIQEYQTELLLITFKDHAQVRNELQRALIMKMVAQKK